MEYINLYRKYRPSFFKDVKGQDHIIKSLTNSILNNNIGHAYLFSGPRGVGKTSVAKIFASALNCYHRNQDDVEPCKNCIENINNSLDIIEFDGASNNTVEAMRTLIEKAQISPINSKYKIYIIDEVHMLSNSAFNSLLKILEEPPKHIIFILATTDPQKIPLTILSRLIRFNFRLMTQKVIIDQLKYIFKKENITYEEDVLQHIARLSTGGMRDALSVSEQAISLCDKNIKIKDLLEAFSIVSNENLISIINFIKEKNEKCLLNLLEDLHRSGIETEKLIYNLIDVLKDYIVYKATNHSNLLNTILKEQVELIKIDFEEARKYIFELYSILKKLYYIENSFEFLEIKLLEISLGIPNVLEVDNKKNNIKNIFEISEQKNKITQNKSIKNTEIIENKINKINEIESPKIETNNESKTNKESKPKINKEQKLKVNEQIFQNESNNNFISGDSKSDLNKYSIEDYASLFLQKNKDIKNNDNLNFERIKYMTYSEFNDHYKEQFSENEFLSIQKSLSACNILFSSEKFLLITSKEESILKMIDKELKKLCIHLMIYYAFNEYRYIYLINDDYKNKLLEYIEKIRIEKIRPKKHKILTPNFVAKFLKQEEEEKIKFFEDNKILKKYQRS
ncbi:DNA polymerase III subunit gamma/tau [Mycoplasma elephantis]|uniref:DNA polymerase III subunit gamma/tau n=1 Tax=Mycoplasma elephantis TaxID=114882 RepID=UPI000690A225|nr:DNA polymerase III subunit gamma/tau [Mycoplasma elephantis]